jgi:hypothetical protein
MEGNQFSQIKSVRMDGGFTRNRVFGTFSTIALRTKSSLFFIGLGWIINPLNISEILFSIAPSVNYKFGFFISLKETLRLLSASVILQTFNEYLNLSVLTLIFVHHIFIVGFIFVFRGMFSKPAQLATCRYINFYYSFINIAFSVSFYMIFVSQLSCTNTDFNKVCKEGAQIASLILACACLVLHVTLSILGILFFFLSNPVVDTPVSGSSNFILVIAEFERLAYAAFFVLRDTDQFDKIFVVCMVLVCLVKISDKFRSNPFYDLKLNRINLIIEGVLVYLVISFVLVLFAGENWASPFSFVITIFSASLLGEAYYFFFEKRIFSKYEQLQKNAMTEEAMIQKSFLVNICIRNVKNGSRYRKFIQRLMFEDKVKRGHSRDTPLKSKDYYYSEEKNQMIEKALANYWRNELEEYLRTHSVNMTLAVHKLFLSVIHSDEVCSIVLALGKVESRDASLLKQFEIFLLKYSKKRNNTEENQ